MSKPLKPERVSAAMRFYAIAFAPVRKEAYERNSLYTLAAEYKKRHPQATAQEAWRHFAGLVGVSVTLVAYDSTADVLTYAPDPERFGTLQIKRRSFERSYYRLP